MSQRCDVCGKEPRFGNQVARLGRNAQRRRVLGRSARMIRPNIQPVKATVNGRPVTSVEQLREVIAKAGNSVALLIQRDNAQIFVPVDLG